MTDQRDAAEAVKPCPFCGESLRKMSEQQGYWHPKANCTLSDLHIEADGYSEARWNQRASLPAATDQEPVAWERKWSRENDHGSKGARPKHYNFHAVTKERLFDEDFPLYAHPAPSDQEKLMGELVDDMDDVDVRAISETYDVAACRGRIKTALENARARQIGEKSNEV